MNKKVNTILFIIGATIFNIVTIVAFWVIIQVLLALLFRESNANMIQYFILPAFIIAIVGNFLLYRFVVKKLDKKFNLEQYFEPIFFRKKR
jgi:uncharacterized BrkB/YihY/UPF0761 family membrane protein